MKKNKKLHKANRQMRCPYCGSPVIFRSADGIYRENSQGSMLYVCSRYPECDSYVRAHPGSGQPMGSLANHELRTLRRTAHFYFDQLYKSGRMSRGDAYMPRGRPRKPETEGLSVSLEVRRSFRNQERKQLREEMQIGARLRQMRGRYNLTQEQVASMLALNRTAYTHYENGVNMPDILTLVRLAAIYEIPAGEFVQFLVKPEDREGPVGSPTEQVG